MHSYRELPLRYAEAGAAASQRARRRAARAHPRAPRHPGRRAHLLHAAIRSRTRSSAASTTRRSCTTSSTSRPVRALDPAGEQARSDEEWDFTEGALPSALERRGLDYALNDGDGAFYGPKIDLHMTDSLGRSWQMGTIQLDSQMPQRFGLIYVGADNVEHVAVRRPPRAASARFERFVGILAEHYGGRLPVLARTRAGAGAAGRRGPPRGRQRARREARALPRRGGRAPTTPSASGSGTPRSRRSRSWSSTGTGERRVAGDPRARRGASRRCRLRTSGRTLLRLRPGKQGRNRLSPPDPVSEVQPNMVEIGPGRCLSAASCHFSKEDHESLVTQTLEAAGRGSWEPPSPPRAADANQRRDSRCAESSTGSVQTGEQLGVKATDEAREYAYGKGLDLVEVAAQRRSTGARR